MRRSIVLFLLLSFVLGGCVSVKEQSKADAFYTFTDSTGAEVTLPKRPEKVAVLFSSYAQIWTLSGGTVDITVGESVERGFVPETAILVDGGAGKTIDRELLLQAQPDFIIGSADIAAQAEVCREFGKLGIPAALFQVDTFPQYLQMLKVCTDITGNADAYETYGTQIERQIQGVMERVEADNPARKKILFIRAGSKYSATKAKRAPDNFVCTMLGELGAVNIADEAQLLLDGLSLEEILLQNPDHIFLTTMGNEDAAVSYIADLFTQDGWKDLQAVKNGNYTFLDKELFHFKPNHRWGQAYEILAQTLYPELKNDE